MTTAANVARMNVAPVDQVDSVTVGKDVLELLTGAMYVDPLTIFREYVQNAADAITLASQEGLYSDGHRPKVDIHLDEKTRTIRIRDNGIGVPSQEFWGRMTSIGASRKRGRKLRGFRGVGRLSGLGYAQEVVFRSKAHGEHTVSEIAWNGRRLKELLRDAHYQGDIEDAVRSVVAVSHSRSDGTENSFFEVELHKVTRIKNDILLNPDEVRRYLSQVAPVPFRQDFSYGREIQDFLHQHGIDAGLSVVVTGSDEPISRPFQDAIQVNERLRDRFHDVEFLLVPGDDGSPHAVGWLLHHSYLGAIPRRTGIGGLRARAGNIQVGNANIFESAFLEPRFNSWCVGELHVISDKILPNGRRDDFEVNAHFQNLQAHAAAVGARISRTCRERSVQRNRLRKAQLLTVSAQEQLLVVRDTSSPSMVRSHYRGLIEKTIARLGRMAIDPKFRPEDQAEIASKANLLGAELSAAPASRTSSKALEFLPPRQRKIFVDTLKLAIAACDTPDQAARMARKVFERARRRKYD